MLKELCENLDAKFAEYDTKRNKIRDKIAQREAQLARLQNKLDKLEVPRWVEEVARPLFEAFRDRFYPGWYGEILGPFGIGACISYHLKPTEESTIHETVFITLIPYLKYRENETTFLQMIDHTQDSGSFAKDTIGEMNGLNYGRIKLDSDDVLQQMYDHVQKEELFFYKRSA